MYLDQTYFIHLVDYSSIFFQKKACIFETFTNHLWQDIANTQILKKRKGAADKVRGKVFTVHAKLIEIAAKRGGDPVMNPGLRTAIDKAKSDNVPNANIERAVRRGTGEDKDGVVYEEATYEAFGPEGSVFMIDVITDNKNRSLGNLRVILQKKGGNLGAAGSVGWKFESKAYFEVAGNGSGDEVEMKIIDCGADDLISLGEGKYEVYAARKIGRSEKCAN